MKHRCYLCHTDCEMTRGWMTYAKVSLTPWQMKGDKGYTGREEWPTFTEPICPVCYLRIARTIDRCHSDKLFPLATRLWHFFFYGICSRYRFFRRLLRPALSELAAELSTSSSGSSES